MVNWNNLTKEEIVHLIEGDLEVEALILMHLVGNVKSQRKMGGMKCYTCESIVRKFGIPAEDYELAKLESLRLMRWLLHELGFGDTLKKAMELHSKYEQRGQT